MEKENILQASSDEFMRLGIKSVSMDDISSKLGISKKTLYQLVENKEDLVTQSMENYLKLEKQLMDEVSIKANDAIDEMIQMGHHTVLALRSMKPTVIHDLRKYYQNVWKTIKEFTENVLGERIQLNLEKGIGEGLYRNNIRPDIISRLYVLKSWSLVDESNFSLNDYKIDELIKQHLEYHLAGILSEKGRKQLKNYELF